MSSEPAFVERLRDAAARATVARLTRVKPSPDAPGRAAAVMMVFAGAEAFDHAHLVLVQRRSDLRKHAGHVAFPGGAVDPTDTDRVDTAVRETWEETRLDVPREAVIATLPELYVPVSDFAVTPVVAWLPDTPPLGKGTPEEIESAHWVRCGKLLDPAVRVQTPLSSGLVGPAFDLPGLFCWGFTAGLLSRYLDLAGLTAPWDDTRVVPVPCSNRWGLPE